MNVEPDWSKENILRILNISWNSLIKGDKPYFWNSTYYTRLFFGRCGNQLIEKMYIDEKNILSKMERHLCAILIHDKDEILS